MDPHSDRLHTEAMDAIMHFTGIHGEAAIAALLRSDYTLEPQLRQAMARALENGRLRLAHHKKGRPQPPIKRLLTYLRHVEIGGFVLERMAVHGVEKAAIAEAVDHYRVSTRLARECKRKAEALRERLP